MVSRGGGRGSRHGDRPNCFVWPPPPSTPRSVPTVVTGYLGPMVLPRHRGAHAVLAAVCWGPLTPPTPQVSLSPAPAAAAPVTTRAAPPYSSAPDPSAPASSALSPAALLAKDEEAFIAVTAQGTTAADDADDAPYVVDHDLAPRSRKGLAHPAWPVPERLVDVDLAPLPRQGLERLVDVNPAPPSRKGLARPARPGLERLDIVLVPFCREGLARPAWPVLATVTKKAEDFLLNGADNDLFHYEVSLHISPRIHACLVRSSTVVVSGVRSS
jgi:eukaryotic translation initiation factor 2C